MPLQKLYMIQQIIGIMLHMEVCFISISQCKDDKKIVISELELVRSDSIGLIQQLLFLIKGE